MKYVANAHLDEVLKAEGLTMNSFADMVSEYTAKKQCMKVSRKFITQLVQNKTVPALDKISTVINVLNSNGIRVNPLDLVTFDIDGTNSIQLLALQKHDDEYVAFVRAQHTSDQHKSAVYGLLPFTLSIEDNNSKDKKDKGKVITVRLRIYEGEQIVEPVQTAVFQHSFTLTDIQNFLYSLEPADFHKISRELFKQIWAKITANHYEQTVTDIHHVIIIYDEFCATFHSVRVEDGQLVFTKSSKDQAIRKAPSASYPAMKPNQVGSIN